MRRLATAFGVLTLIVIAIFGSIWYLAKEQKPAPPAESKPAHIQEDISIPETTKLFSSKELSSADSHFDFSAEIPKGWQAEYIPNSSAISLYDPSVATTSGSIEKSQIFVKYFVADKFLTLQTVDILEKNETIVNGHPAVKYRIVKKEGVKNFLDQPLWRNGEHSVLDIRSSDAVPSVFYVFAKNPSLSESVFEDFIQNVSFGGEQEKIALSEPIENLRNRIVRKPFGLYVTPESSPVSPERFTGYHTGADFETFSAEKNKNVFIMAAADGTIVLVKKISGYGGLVVIKHRINGTQVYGLYGHLKVESSLLVGAKVKAGEPFAVLGEGFTDETDFERKHLHFALYQGEKLDIRGYVKSRDELKNWLDPLQFFSR